MQAQWMNMTMRNIDKRVSQVNTRCRKEGSIVGAWRDVESHACQGRYQHSVSHHGKGDVPETLSNRFH